MICEDYVCIWLIWFKFILIMSRRFLFVEDDVFLLFVFFEWLIRLFIVYDGDWLVLMEFDKWGKVKLFLVICWLDLGGRECLEDGNGSWIKVILGGLFLEDGKFWL